MIHILPGMTYGESLRVRRETIARNKAAKLARQEAALTSPIAKAVEPLRVAAMEEAEKRAKLVIKNVTKALNDAGNDINVAAPYPRALALSKTEYRTKLARHSLFVRLTKSRKGSHHPNEPHLADIAKDRCQDFIKEARKQAAEQYRLYVEKLVHKVGPVNSAKLTGKAVWDFSILTVKTASGEEQNWKTQTIWNQSKYQFHFPQFPTRKVN